MNMVIPQFDYNDKELIAFIGHQESQRIKTTVDYRDSVAERLKNGRVLRGDKLPWGKTHEYIAFAEGQVSIWAGINGHKKSMLLSMVMMWFSRIAPAGIASFEMPVIDTMERLISQAAGCSPAKQFGQDWLTWGENKLFFYDQLDTVPTERVLGVIYYMATQCGCKHVMIDSLAKCGVSANDKDAEKRFIELLVATAKALKIHIHLVAHVRKPPQGGDEYIPQRFDIRGAGELTDLVDNVLVVWADKKREKLKRKELSSNTLTDSEREYLDSRPDQRLVVRKQRNWFWEDTVALWFDDDSLQFMGDNTRGPMGFDIQQIEGDLYGGR